MKVIFPKEDVAVQPAESNSAPTTAGDYVLVKVKFDWDDAAIEIQCIWKNDASSDHTDSTDSLCFHQRNFKQEFLTVTQSIVTVCSFIVWKTNFSSTSNIGQISFCFASVSGGEKNKFLSSLEVSLY